MIKLNELTVTAYPQTPFRGMHIGAVLSGISLTHKPSGITINCDEQRSPHKNKAQALYELRLILEVIEEHL